MANGNGANQADKKPVCKYGAKCYRKNADHLRNYSHPPKRQAADTATPSAKRPRDDASPSPAAAAATSGGDGTSPVCQAPAQPATATPAGTTPSKPKHDDTGHKPSGHDVSASDSDGENDGKPAEAGEKSNDEAGKEEEKDEEAEEEDILPPSPVSDRENIKQKFLVEMPKDFYSFLRFCKSYNSDKPEEALSATGLRLGGPFRLLLGLIKPPKRTQRFYLTYCRYYYDSPEVQTVLCGDDARGEHLAYFRDEPTALPVQVVSNCAEQNGNFTVHGDNLFAAVNKRLSSQLSSSPPNESELKRLQSALQDWASRNNFTLETRTPAMRARDKLVLGKTLQGFGVVVPYDKKTEVGYREVPEPHARLRKMLRDIVQADTQQQRMKALDNFGEIMHDVQFANDEGDPGMGLELGLDVFGFGGEALNPTLMNLLPLAYDLLNRPVSAQILQAHMADRRRGPPIL